MLQQAIAKLVEGQDLTAEQARGALGEIMSGAASEAHISAFLVGLRMKGETPGEIAGLASVMREHALCVRPRRPDVVDTCGTGGDGARTFNVSTTAAFIAAGAGVAIAKHGNRSVSSSCGSADVLEALGARIDLPPERVAECIDELGLGFMFAPAFHPAMKHVMPTRKALGVRTVFNVLGPLTNPAGARRQLLGVYAPALTGTLAHALQQLGSERAMVVHGLDGLDELSTLGPTTVADLAEGAITTYELDPAAHGFPRATLSDIAGGSADECAKWLLAVLDGEPGPRADIALLNAAAGIMVGGLAESIGEGVERARESVASGSAKAKLAGLVAFATAAP